MVEQITLYTAKICPYAQRVEIALAEAGAEFTRFEIDLMNKPEWYAPKINPASKVPAIAYGGPKVSPDDPSSESVKLAESLVLTEFVADLFPNSDLLPKDPVTRARARFVIDFVSNKFLAVGGAFFFAKGGPIEPVVEALETLQTLLPPVGHGKYLLGDKFTLADIALAPFLGRQLLVSLPHGIGKFDKEDGKRLYEIVQGPKFERLRQYFSDISERKSWKDTFPEEYLIDVMRKRFA